MRRSDGDTADENGRSISASNVGQRHLKC
jgi:hypothetical protein